MKSNGNSFSGDVVLDSVTMAFSDEDSIMDQIYQKLTFSELINEDFKF